MKSTIIIAIAFIFIGCEKKPEKQIIGSWKVEKIELSNDGAPFVDQQLGCSDDNIWVFEKGGTFKILDGINLCSGGSTTGTWALDEAGTTITFTYDGYVGNYLSTVITLDKTALVTVHEAGTVIPSQYRYTFSAY